MFISDIIIIILHSLPIILPLYQKLPIELFNVLIVLINLSICLTIMHYTTKSKLNAIIEIRITGETVAFTTIDNKLYIFKVKDITKIVFNENGYKIIANGKTLRANKHDYDVKVISDDNARDYISFTDFPYAQYEEGEFFM